MGLYFSNLIASDVHNTTCSHAYIQNTWMGHKDDNLLFSVVLNANTTAKELNNDLVKANRWAYQWKMSFNSNPGKQAQEVIFSIISWKARNAIE